MKTNIAKIKILVYARDPLIKAEVYIDSQKLDKDHKMVYLWSKIKSDDKSIREINHRIKKDFIKKKKTIHKDTPQYQKDSH